MAWYALLNGIGRTRDALWTTALGSGVSVASGIALIGVVGVSGAIVGQIVGPAVSLVVGTWLVQKRVEAGLGIARVWKYYFASGVAAALTWPLSWLVHTPELAIVGGAVLFVILYIPLLALLRTLDEKDIDALRGYLEFSAVASMPVELGIAYYKLALSILRRRRSPSGE